MILRQLFVVFAAYGLLVGAAPTRPDYGEGQVWEYKNRPVDAGSLIKIQKIESYPTQDSPGKVYHISVIGLDFRDLDVPGEVHHLPVSKETLNLSVTRLSVSSATFPPADEGIAAWREA